MLTAITVAGRQYRFTTPQAEIPLLTREGGMRLVQWGRRLRDGGDPLPLGAWIDLEELRSDKWKGFYRTPVKVPANRFWMSGPDGEAPYPVPAGKVLQGVVLTAGDPGFPIQIAYLVAIPSGADVEMISKRWPRIV